ncbi:uncharacterized protein [Primulina huaijiensis]|uniref:uncharacterized protein n=1 Tax=Primulina huaijiensis TaxID=1492673 RepID=UPI003CC6F921
MVSLASLHRIEKRLQQASCNMRPFGGYSIILFGDFWQLPPVADRALYYNVHQDRPAQDTTAQDTTATDIGSAVAHASQPNVHRLPPTKGPSIEDISGFTKYRQFTESVELKVQQRQQGNQDAFKAALEGLRNSDVTLAHWETLTTRCQANLSLSEIRSFEDAIRLYPTGAMVNEFNHGCQRDSKQPILKVSATHKTTDAIAAAATGSQAGQLEAQLDLCIGCKLMILENLWTERGIVNGTQCRLYDIVWRPGTDPRKDPPLCLLVAVPKESYGGPYVEEYSFRGLSYAVVPIFRSKRDFWLNGETRYRTQFPVKLAYALTIHKAQGMTLPKAVLNLTQGTKNVSVYYVGVSRVKRLEDVMFEEAFDLERLTAATTALQEMRQQDEEDDLYSSSQPPTHRRRIEQA